MGLAFGCLLLIVVVVVPMECDQNLVIGIINNMSTNNAVINNTTTGITNQDIQLITQPYQERITTLEQKLTEVNTSQIIF
jgi:hypothetical protein